MPRIVHLEAGDLVQHISECPICRAWTKAHDPDGTKADHGGLCSEGSRLLVAIERVIDAVLVPAVLS